MDEPLSPFFPYSYPPSTGESPAPTDESLSPIDEPPSPLLKSRIPIKTTIVDKNLFINAEASVIDDLCCPLRKGIIYYSWDDAIFERNIYSLGKHEPRIIVPKRPSKYLETFSFIPIKGNRILLFAGFGSGSVESYLHLSIYEVRSDNRVGPALWSFNDVHDRFDLDEFQLIKSSENTLGITFGMPYTNHWKLFDISTTETDALDNFPLVESGRIDFDEANVVEGNSIAILSPDRRILLNADSDKRRYDETIDIHYSDSDGTNNMIFSFVTCMSTPISSVPEMRPQRPHLAFSADGSKFAMVIGQGRVSVWDIRSEVPLQTFMEIYNKEPHVRYLQFSSGKLAKEVLVYVERDHLSPFEIIHVVDATSFETEELLPLKLEGPGAHLGVDAVFFDPSGGTLYAEFAGTLYE